MNEFSNMTSGYWQTFTVTSSGSSTVYPASASSGTIYVGASPSQPPPEVVVLPVPEVDEDALTWLRRRVQEVCDEVRAA